ncbi:Nn.00g097360.m01.CDS01 [Neocucurbitaria sp. VM-36]
MRSLSTYLSLAALLPFARTQVTKGSNEQPTASAPHRNPWKVLSIDESASVEALLQKRFNLNFDEGNSHDSFVYQITLLQPNKTDVVPFLDSDTREPARYARATVSFGATDLYWQEFIVGPLPATNSTKIEPLTYPFHNVHPGKTKAHPIYSANDASQFLSNFGSEVEDITKALWNSTLAEGNVGVRLGVPFWEEDGQIISWAAFFATPNSDLGSPTLLVLGVSVRFDLTSRNWEDWKATGWYSGGKFYESTEDFRNTVFSSNCTKPQPNVDGNWTSTDRQGEPLPLDELPPPVSVSQGTQRFKLDATEDYVSWMDFSFYFSVSRDVGLSLFDIQYKGKRLIYELSLQEAVTLYAGSEPFASQATFFDTVDGLGASLVSLVRGYDCPSHATYLNATFSVGNTTKTQVDAICIFEFDAGYPIRRHSYPAMYASVAKNVVFTVRTISTVGNYDFMIEYQFFYDGSIEVSVRASGFISAAYWDGNGDYGFHIHDYLSGSLHDHVLTFKADLDVMGRQNTLQKIDFVTESTDYPWSQGKIHDTFKASRSFLSKESSVSWADNDAAIFAIVNKDSPNRFGEFPGYRIKRSAGTSHFTTGNSTNTRKAAASAYHDFYITKQKDTEPRAADSYNQFAPEDPLVDFTRFFNDESIEQEDVVVWFNLGMHHMPHTGDLPNTMFTAAHSAIRFEPLNYLDGDPSVASNQQVRVHYSEDGSIESIEEFGKLLANVTCG